MLHLFYRILLYARSEYIWTTQKLKTLKGRQDHDDVIKWKHFPRYWPFMRGIHRSPVNSPHKGQWCGALMFSLICTRISGRVNNGEAGDLRRHHAHYDVIVMMIALIVIWRRKLQRPRWWLGQSPWRAFHFFVSDLMMSLLCHPGQGMHLYNIYFHRRHKHS